MMKSTYTTRRLLKEHLEKAIKANPKESSLQEALDIVEDLISYFDEIDGEKCLLLIHNSSDNQVRFISPNTLQEIETYEWDENSSDLGIMVEAFLI